MYNASVAQFRSTCLLAYCDCYCVGSWRHCWHDERTYEALWADNKDFNEVVISPTMVNDHMPDNVLDALEKVSRFCSSFVLV